MNWESYFPLYVPKYFQFQFLHNVVLVRREDSVWKVRHEHVITGEIFEEEYDYVVVGNGHFSKPNMPNISGQDIFKGENQNEKRKRWMFSRR